jgi:hypothetical protein
VLQNHEDRQVIGSVVRGSARVDADKKCRCTIELYPEEGEILQRVKSGARRNSVSVGYNRLGVIGTGPTRDGIRTLKFSWEPYEVSLLEGIEAADENVGFGRSKPKITMNEDTTFEEGQDRQPTRQERRAGMTQDFRVREIRGLTDAIAPDHPQREEEIRQMCSRAILTGESIEQFRGALMSMVSSGSKRNQMVPVSDADYRIGMSPAEINRYSLMRAIRCVINGKPLDGLEGEAHRAHEDKFKQTGDGFWVPFDIMATTRTSGQRDMTVGGFSQGGATVATNLFATPIEILRNRMVTIRLGAPTLSGLSGNIAIPRQTGAATAYSLPETASLTKSNQSIDQILLSPHRVGAYEEYSKQLLLQSSTDIENFMRSDLMKQVAIKWDKLALEGNGASSEPMGILNTSGIGSVTFGGAATLAKIIAFETALAAANADDGRMAYVTTPTAKAKLKAVPKLGATFPIFLWEKGDWGDGTNDGRLNDEYRAASTNQISNDAMVFGNWNDLIVAMWGGYDVVVNPYARDIDAVVRITVNTFGDVAVRHAASFAWSSDSAAQ